MFKKYGFLTPSWTLVIVVLILLILSFCISFLNTSKSHTNSDLEYQFCGNHDAKITFSGRGLLAATAHLGSDRATQCRLAIRKFLGHEMSFKEEIDFMTQELKAWEHEQELVKYIQREIK